MNLKAFYLRVFRNNSNENFLDLQDKRRATRSRGGLIWDLDRDHRKLQQNLLYMLVQQTCRPRPNMVRITHMQFRIKNSFRDQGNFISFFTDFIENITSNYFVLAL